MSSDVSNALQQQLNGRAVSNGLRQNGHVEATSGSSGGDKDSPDSSSPDSKSPASQASSPPKESASPDRDDHNSCGSHDNSRNSKSRSDESNVSGGSDESDGKSDSESESEMSPEESLNALQRDSRTVQLLQWSRIFAGPLFLRPFGAEELEGALLQPEEHRVFLSELVWKLLRKGGGDRYHADEHSEEAWSGGLNHRDLYSFHPMQNIDFFALSPTKRMRLLYKLTMWRTDECPLLRDYTRKADASGSAAAALRAEVVGQDSKGWQYIAFGSGSEDVRLYRQLPPAAPKGKAPPLTDDDANEEEENVPWEVATSSVDELEDLIKQLESSRSKVDKKFGGKLSKQLLPGYLATAGARKRAVDRAAALEAAPKKRSSRLQVLQQQQRAEQAAVAAIASRREERASKAESARKADEKERRTLRAAQYNEAREAAAEAYRRSMSGLKQGPSRQQRMAQRAAVQCRSSSLPGGGGDSGGEAEDARSRPRKRRKRATNSTDDEEQDPHVQADGSVLSPTARDQLDHVDGTSTPQRDANGRPRRATAGRRQTQSLADQQALSAWGGSAPKPSKHADVVSRQTPAAAAASAEKAAAAARELLKEKAALRVQVAREAALEERQLLARPYRTVAIPHVPEGFAPTRSTRSGRAGFEDKPLPQPAAKVFLRSPPTHIRATLRTAPSTKPPVDTQTDAAVDSVTKGSEKRLSHQTHQSAPKAAATMSEATTLPARSYAARAVNGVDHPQRHNTALAPSAGHRSVGPQGQSQPHPETKAMPDSYGHQPPAAPGQPDSWSPGDALVAVQSRSAAAHRPRSSLWAIAAAGNGNSWLPEQARYDNSCSDDTFSPGQRRRPAAVDAGSSEGDSASVDEAAGGNDTRQQCREEIQEELCNRQCDQQQTYAQFDEKAQLQTSFLLAQQQEWASLPPDQQPVLHGCQTAALQQFTLQRQHAASQEHPQPALYEPHQDRQIFSQQQQQQQNHQQPNGHQQQQEEWQQQQQQQQHVQIQQGPCPEPPLYMNTCYPEMIAGNLDSPLASRLTDHPVH